MVGFGPADLGSNPSRATFTCASRRPWWPSWSDNGQRLETLATQNTVDANDEDAQS